MSSPLDGRIRALAREEAAQAIREGGVQNTSAVDTDGLEQRITGLHEEVHHVATAVKRLEARLDVLEKATAQPDPQRPAGRRTARKDTSE